VTEPSVFAEFVTNFHFLRPLWLLALIPALLLVYYLWHLNESVSSWDRAIDKDLLPYLLDTHKTAAERTPLILLLALWSLTSIALAGPVWEKIAQPVQERQDALVIVYDQSLSMYATDYDPNRLTVSKRKMMDILARRVEGQTGLIVYAGDAHTVTPLTEDSVTMTALLPSISPNIMPSFGSNTLAAIDLAKSLLSDAGAVSGTILLATDGVEQRDHEGIAARLAGSNYRLAILGIGTPAGAPIPAAGGDFLRDANGTVVVPRLDRDSLQSLARLVNGRYADMQLESDDIDYLLEEDGFFGEEELTDVDQNFDIWYEVGPWALLLVLPLCALIFRRGWILTIALSGLLTGALLPSQQAHAADWSSLWRTPDQQGARAYENRDPAGAAELFESPEWRGAAAYHAGDFQGAINAYTSTPPKNADSHYNLGNAYAKALAFEEAIASYDLAIAMDPEHEDAIHNRAIVQELLEEQQQQEQEQEQQEQPEGMQEEQEEQQPQEEGQQEENEQEQQQEEPGEEGEEEEMESEEHDSQDPSEQQESAQDEGARNPSNSNAEAESQESLEQWLRRIDDDPGELLQRKFQFEYRRRQLENRSASTRSGESQIW